MGYTTISIRKKNNSVRKYILFYADYLGEAWLSEVLDNDTTRIVKQFKCKSLLDLNDLAAYISRNGEVINLSSNENPEIYLRILEKQLTKKRSALFVEKLNLMYLSVRMSLRKAPDFALAS